MSSKLNKDESVASWAAGMRHWEPQVLLLTLETQSKTRHAATDGQNGTDDNPHLEETRVQSLSGGGIKILEPEGWNDASEKAGPGLTKLLGCRHKSEGGR